MLLVEEIWREGVEFKKVGVLLTCITEQGVIQLSLFEEYGSEEARPKLLNQPVDQLNCLYGRGSFCRDGIPASLEDSRSVKVESLDN